MIDWLAFLEVAVASLLGGGAVVSLYALGLRLLAVSGRTPYVAPQEFEEAITVLTPKEVKREVKRVRKARKRNPYTTGQKRAALAGAYAVFAFSGVLVLAGVWLIVRS